MKRARKLLPLLLAFMMILQMFTMVPVSAADKVGELMEQRVEAENFATRPAGDGLDIADEDGGTVVIDLNDTDVMTYDGLDFGELDTSNVTVRVWFGSEDSAIEFRSDAIDGPVVGSVTAEDASSLNTWTTIETGFTGVLGKSELFLEFKGNVKFNYMTYTKALPYDPNLFLYFAHADEEKGDGVLKELSGSLGVDIVRFNNTGDTFIFRDVDFSPVTTEVILCYGKGDNDGLSFEARLDSESGTVLAAWTGKNTGGYASWTEASIPVPNVTGKHDVYFTTYGNADIAYLKLIRPEDYAPPAQGEDGEEAPAFDEKALEEAKLRLGNLNVMIGDDFGFREFDSLTRAEATKVVVCILGLGNTVATGNATPRYSDIAADHWANPYINLATDMGIVAGMGDGTFAPDAPLTNEQALKMILNAAGYEPMAEENGGYPLGYLIAASDLEVVTEDMDIVGNAEASRGNFAIFVNRIIETPMMIKVNTAKGSYVVSGDANTEKQTLLRNFLKTETYTANVTRSTADKLEVKITASDFEKDKAKVGKTLLFAKDEIKIADSISVGDVVELSMSGNDYIALWQKENETYLYDYIYAVNGDTSETSYYTDANVETVTLYLDDETYDIADDFEIYVKGEKATKSVLLNGSYAKVTLDGSNIARLDVFPLQEGGILTQVMSTSLRYSFGENSLTLRHLDDCDHLDVIIDGEPGTLSDLTAEMVIDFCEYGDENYFIVASSKNVSGSISRLMDAGAQIAIDDYKYWVDDTFDSEMYFAVGRSKNFRPIEEYDGIYDIDTAKSEFFNDLLGSEVTAYLAPNNKIRFVWSRGGANGQFYGVIGKIWEEGDQYMEVYNLSEGEGLLTSKSYPVKLKKGSVLAVDDITDESSKYYSAVGKARNNAIYKFNVNTDGEIESITPLEYAKVDGKVNGASLEIEIKDLRTQEIPRDGSAAFKVYTVQDMDANGNVTTKAEGIKSVGTRDMQFFTFDDGLGNRLVPRTLKWDDIHAHLVVDSRVDGSNLQVTMFVDPAEDERNAVIAVITEGLETIGLMETRGALVHDIYPYDSDRTTVELKIGDRIETHTVFNNVAAGIYKNAVVCIVGKAFTSTDFGNGVLFREVKNLRPELLYDAESTEWTDPASSGELRYYGRSEVISISSSTYKIRDGSGSEQELQKDGSMVVYEIDPDSDELFVEDSFDHISVGDIVYVGGYEKDGIKHTVALFYER